MGFLMVLKKIVREEMLIIILRVYGIFVYLLKLCCVL